MSVNLIFKIAAVGILVSVLAGLLLVLFWILPYISDLFDDIRRLFAL